MNYVLKKEINEHLFHISWLENNKHNTNAQNPWSFYFFPFFIGYNRETNNNYDLYNSYMHIKWIITKTAILISLGVLSIYICETWTTLSVLAYIYVKLRNMNYSLQCTSIYICETWSTLSVLAYIYAKHEQIILRTTYSLQCNKANSKKLEHNSQMLLTINYF